MMVPCVFLPVFVPVPALESVLLRSKRTAWAQLSHANYRYQDIYVGFGLAHGFLCAQYPQHFKTLELLVFCRAKPRELNFYLGFHFFDPCRRFDDPDLHGFHGRVGVFGALQYFFLVSIR